MIGIEDDDSRIPDGIGFDPECGARTARECAICGEADDLCQKPGDVCSPCQRTENAIARGDIRED